MVNTLMQSRQTFKKVQFKQPYANLHLFTLFIKNIKLSIVIV